VDSLLEFEHSHQLAALLAQLFPAGSTWVFWLAVYYVMLLPIAPGAPVWWALFADAILAAGVALPQAPAGLGVYEGAMTLALTILGFTKPVALAYAIILHFTSFILTAIFGFWG